MKFKLIDESKKKNKKHELGYFTSFLPDKEKGIDKFNNAVDFGKVDGSIDGGVTAISDNTVSESLDNISDFIDKAEVLLVDDAENFDINRWERDLQKEIAYDLGSEYEEVSVIEKNVDYEIDNDSLDKIIHKIVTEGGNTLSRETSWKTHMLVKKNGLSWDDFTYVIAEIKSDEYDRVIRKPNVATIFLNNDQFGKYELTIKLDYENMEETPVIIISVHKGGKVNNEELSESSEEDRLTKLFNECVSELKRIGYDVDDDIDVKFNNAKSFFAKTTTIPNEDDRFVITLSKHLNKETDEFIKDIIYHELAHYLTSKKAIKETVLKKDRFGGWSIFPMLKKYYTQHGEIWKNISDDICSKLNCHIERVHDSDTTDDIYNEDIRNEEMDKKEALSCLEEFEEEETEKCVWCGDYFPIEDLNKEKDMGYLCDHCRMALQSRGEELDFEDECDESLHEEKEDEKIKIKIDVLVSNDLEEKIVSGNAEDKYDDQTLADWYDFADNIEGIVRRNYILYNINFSANPDSLSEYMDFYRKDEEGNKIDGLINLRLSDHKPTRNAQKIRLLKVNKVDTNYKLVTIIVNEKYFNSYDEALEYVKKILNDLNK